MPMYNVICLMIIYSVKNKKNRTTFSIRMRRILVFLLLVLDKLHSLPLVILFLTFDIFSLAARSIFRNLIECFVKIV